MRLRIWDRILSALMGLILIAMGAAGLLYLLGIVPDWHGQFFSQAVIPWQRWTAVGGCIVMILLGLHGASLLVRRRKDKGFVIQRTELGDMSISMKAMENMVKKCVESHVEMKASHTHIYRSRNGICVELRIMLPSGMNIPLTVNALQKQIKQYITSCSGVDVHEVRVKVETDIAKLAAPAEMPALDVPAAEEKPVQSVAEQLCKHQEEPQVYAEKPACEVPEAPCADDEIPQAAEPQEESVEAEDEPAEQAEETIEAESEGNAEEVEA